MEFEWINSRIADETIELVLLFNEKGNILYGNQTAAAKLEFDKDKLTRCSMSQIFRQDFPDTSEGFLTFVKNCMKGVKEMTMYRSNNSCFSVNVRIQPAEEADVYLLLAEDISAQKNLNMRIRELKEKEGENMERTENSLILVVCARGCTDDVMSTAKAHGARGGTVIKGRLSGLEELEQTYEVDLKPEREIVAIVVPTKLRASIMEAVNTAHGLRSEAQAVLCSLPIEQIVRLG